MANSLFTYKYDKAVDNESAYEVLEVAARQREEQQELERQKAEQEKLEKERQKAEEKEAARREKEEAKKTAAEQRKKERIKSKIESQFISTGGQLLRKGLFSILKRK